MALTQQQRDRRRLDKAAARKEEDLRLKVLEGTKQALADLMLWSDIEEQGEALTLMIHHLHALGPEIAKRFFEVPHHKYEIPENVERKLEIAYRREALRICRDD